MRNSNEGVDTLEIIPDAVPVELTEPPIEEQLAWHTLWPESHKLHGHGNELFSLCCDHKGELVASSLKSKWLFNYLNFIVESSLLDCDLILLCLCLSMATLSKIITIMLHGIF